ncbi:uncharacterized protein LOC100200841 isoform X2 [Hydra vulgaris]|uniref:Uncharacterized protein LOC100200841 isoform X2 n=1 Tax=Hydra vulgaris TaxID=6087 RepID=A0ABM4C2V8_HYDVU
MEKVGPPPDYYLTTDHSNQAQNLAQNPSQVPSYYQGQPIPYYSNPQNVTYQVPPAPGNQVPPAPGNQVPYYNPYQTNVIIHQPAVTTGVVYTGPPPNSHRALAWLTCLFCCWPLGVASIIKSMEVDTAIAQNNLIRAQMASESAKKFGFASLGCGIFMHLIWIIYLIIYFVIFVPNFYSRY